jgi:hypothetical protein
MSRQYPLGYPPPYQGLPKNELVAEQAEVVKIAEKHLVSRDRLLWFTFFGLVVFYVVSAMVVVGLLIWNTVSINTNYNVLVSKLADVNGTLLHNNQADSTYVALFFEKIRELNTTIQAQDTQHAALQTFTIALQTQFGANITRLFQYLNITS